MSSSDEALGFFKDWLTLETKLAVVIVAEGISLNAVGTIVEVDEDLRLANPNGGLSVSIPLTGCTFDRADPVRDKSGLPQLDDLREAVGFKFGWEIVLPSTGRIVLMEVESLS